MKLNIGIRSRLFLAILLAAGLAVASVVIVTQWNLSRGFLRYVNTMEKSSVSRLTAKLEAAYVQESGWELLRRDPERWRQLVVESLLDAGLHHRQPADAPPQPGAD